MPTRRKQTGNPADAHKQTGNPADAHKQTGNPADAHKQTGSPADARKQRGSPSDARKRKEGAADARKAVVVGGGIAGLAMAICLARRGWRVRVLERDRRPPADSPEEAFRVWKRSGVPQFRHSHTFLARLTTILREDFPEVLAVLRSAGTVEIPLTVGTPPGLDLGPREKGDGELVLLGARRAAFEWALLEVARRTPGVEITEGVYCEDLTSEPAARGRKPRITGVRIRTLPDGESSPGERGIPWHAGATPRPRGRSRRIPADLVIDASGRRSRADRWLAATGAPPLGEERVPTGIYYFTRFYRLTGRRPPGGSTGLVAGDVGWLKLATFPGDDDTFSITVGANIDDRPFRALSDPAIFETLIAAFPQISAWRACGVSEPIDGPDTPVLVMGGLENLRRRFEHRGAVVAHGFAAIGDAMYHSNPIYGRGVTTALLSVTLLDRALADHPTDAERALAEYHRRARIDIEPFWQHAAGGDRLAHATRRHAREDNGDLWSWAWSWLRDPNARIEEITGRVARIFLEQGFGPAVREDGQVFRAAMRVMNMLDHPREGLLSPIVLARTLPFLARSLLWPSAERPFPGPSRREALALIEAARSRAATPRLPSRANDVKGAKDARRAPRSPLRPDSEVAGHA